MLGELCELLDRKMRLHVDVVDGTIHSSYTSIVQCYKFTPKSHQHIYIVCWILVPLRTRLEEAMDSGLRR